MYEGHKIPTNFILYTLSKPKVYGNDYENVSRYVKYNNTYNIL